MNNFQYTRAVSSVDALTQIAAHPDARFLGGGTNLVDLMREDIEHPPTLIDVTRLDDARQITDTAEGGLLIGAAVKNTAVANDARVRQRYPLLSQAILCGASGQIRNMATVAGNLMQRTRCYYFYDTASRCNKRTPGAGCDALDGFNRIHAVLGTSEACIATHPSDMCVALAALGAIVHVQGPNAAARTIPFEDFHRLPADTPHLETALEAGELITAVELPPLDFAAQSVYRKVRDRASYAFALVSVAAAASIEDGRFQEIRLALGGVGTRPWRAHKAEAALEGAPATLDTIRHAADAEMSAARGREHNRFKIELARRTITMVLAELAEIIA